MKVLSIDLPHRLRLQRLQRLPARELRPRGAARRSCRSTARPMTAEFFPGIVIPLQAVLRQHGRGAAAGGGPRQQQPAEPLCRQHGQPRAHRRLHALHSRCSCPGALFAVGDGHAAQGDGEVDQTAIETSLRGRLQLTVRKGEPLNWPRAETPTDYISMGADPDLAVATTIAIQEMVDFLARTRGLTTHQAYQLVSVAGQRGRDAARRPAHDGRAREGAEEHLQVGGQAPGSVQPGATVPSAAIVSPSPARPSYAPSRRRSAPRSRSRPPTAPPPAGRSRSGHDARPDSTTRSIVLSRPASGRTRTTRPCWLRRPPPSTTRRRTHRRSAEGPIDRSLDGCAWFLGLR